MVSVLQARWPSTCHHCCPGHWRFFLETSSLGLFFPETGSQVASHASQGLVFPESWGGDLAWPLNWHGGFLGRNFSPCEKTTTKNKLLNEQQSKGLFCPGSQGACVWGGQEMGMEGAETCLKFSLPKPHPVNPSFPWVSLFHLECDVRAQ